MQRLAAYRLESQVHDKPDDVASWPWADQFATMLAQIRSLPALASG